MKKSTSILKTISANWASVTIIGTLVVFGWNAKDFLKGIIRESVSDQVTMLIKNDSIQVMSQVKTNLILKDLSTKIDSGYYYAKKAYDFSKLNFKANVEMSKKIKDFDIFKIYDPFMFIKNDTIKKNFPCQQQYARSDQN